VLIREGFYKGGTRRHVGGEAVKVETQSVGRARNNPSRQTTGVYPWHSPAGEACWAAVKPTMGGGAAGAGLEELYQHCCPEGKSG